MLRTIGIAALALNASAWGALPASEVARYADEATFVICRADVAQLDMDAFWTSIERCGPPRGSSISGTWGRFG